MSITGITSLERLHLNSESLGLFASAKALPLDFCALVCSPFQAKDLDKIFLENLLGKEPTDADVVRIIDLLNSGKYPKISNEMCALFKQLKPELIEKIIQKGLQNALQKDGLEIPVERYFEMPWDELLNNEDELNNLHSYFQNLPKNDEATSSTNIFEETHRFICYIIDIMISLTSVNYFLDDPGYLAHSENSKPIVYAIMITNVTALYGLMFALQGAVIPAAGATAGTIFLLIGAVKLYRKFIRPAEEMYPLINLNRETEKGFSNKHNIDQNVIDTIATNVRSKNPIFITGPSGVGKTTHVSAFAEQVDSGKYPELNGKRVYYINTPVLLDSGQKSYSSNSLTDILRHLHGKEDEVILFFDEAHAAWNEENQSLAEQFKWISDNFSVLFATTDKEYQMVSQKNSESFQALQRRHKLIEMSSQSDEETLAIMRKKAQALFPELPLTNAQLQLFLTLTKQEYPDRAQPEAALKYLEEAFSVIRKSPQNGPEIKRLKAELVSLRAEPNSENIAKIDAINTELQAHEKESLAKKGEHRLFLDLLKDKHRISEAQGSFSQREWKFFHTQLAPALDRRINLLSKKIFPTLMENEFILGILKG